MSVKVLIRSKTQCMIFIEVTQYLYSFGWSCSVHQFMHDYSYPLQYRMFWIPKDWLGQVEYVMIATKTGHHCYCNYRWTILPVISCVNSLESSWLSDCSSVSLWLVVFASLFYRQTEVQTLDKRVTTKKHEAPMAEDKVSKSGHGSWLYAFCHIESYTGAW